MVILKHISSRNSSYLAALDYLMYKHDEFKKVPLLDDNGFMIPRENMLIDLQSCVKCLKTPFL